MAAEKLNSGSTGEEIEKKRTFPFGEVPSIRNVLVDELQQRGGWIVANVDTGTTWPVTAQKYRFRGEDIWIIPITQECYGGVAIRERADLNAAACRKLILRFLSAISWVYEQGISLAHGFTGGTFPQPLGRPNKMGISMMQDFDLSYCPEPVDPKAQLALGLMREGRGLNNPGYAFLSFYRVIEAAIPDGVQRRQWITAKIPTLRGHRTVPVIAKLTSDGVQNIGEHLYKSNRMAVAHAQREPIVDPDDYEELRRLEQETPIVLELATIAIEEMFGMETRHTVYNKHLYEVAGWKDVIGPDIVAKVAAGEQLVEGAVINLPKINVGLRDRAPAEPHLKMKASSASQYGKVLAVEYVSPCSRVLMRFGLDFGNERLDCDMFQDMAVRDDGTADAVATLIQHQAFKDALFCNGQLHVYDADTGKLLGRKDAYMPMNMFFDPEGARAHLSILQAEEEARRKREAAAGNPDNAATRA